MVRAQEKWIRQGGTRGTIIENGLFRIRQYRLRGHFFLTEMTKVLDCTLNLEISVDRFSCNFSNTFWF